MGLTGTFEPKRFTAVEFDRMCELGVLGLDERVELLDGQIFVMTPQGPTHASFATEFRDRFREAYRHGFTVREDKPIVASTNSQPEPDIAVIPGTNLDFMTRHPRTDEAVLILEIAWTTQDYDQRKVAIYAAGRAPVLWLLDLAGRELQVHTSPTRTGRYRTVRTLTEDDSVELPAIGVTWRVADLLPQRV